ncbi:hypothetical protein B0I35DRAFT_404431 [Stachybotrys elegans]|uniref:Uncharacterized protein n=1 Tax=Stachybotrys elegans TaxID=80388 RepID=A0A8K0T2U2_9HYPO|nr:hypothetical protein B0I35DRAFT_404431 [Stachybotrys elegans]
MPEAYSCPHREQPIKRGERRNWQRLLVEQGGSTNNDRRGSVNRERDRDREVLIERGGSEANDRSRTCSSCVEDPRSISLIQLSQQRSAAAARAVELELELVVAAARGDDPMQGKAK